MKTVEQWRVIRAQCTTPMEYAAKVLADTIGHRAHPGSVNDATDEHDWETVANAIEAAR